MCASPSAGPCDTHRMRGIPPTISSCVARWKMEQSDGAKVFREYVTGETVESAMLLLKASNFPIRPSPVVAFADVPRFVDELRLAPVPSDDRGVGGNAARCALELAVLDAYCRRFRKPLSEMTRVAAPALFTAQKQVRYSGIITSSDGFKLRLIAWGYRLYGFDQIKLKVGLAGQDDVRRLGIIRRRVGPRIRIRIDANEAWRPAEAVRRIKDLEPLGICSVEQPVAHEEAAVLRELRRQISTPVMLDESLCGLADAQRASVRVFAISSTSDFPSAADSFQH